MNKFMEMTFGKAHDIWGRVIDDDKTLTPEEVAAAGQWFDDFSSKLGGKAKQSEQAYEDACKSYPVNRKEINRLRKSAESDERQLDDCIRKFDDLTNWLNNHQ